MDDLNAISRTSDYPPVTNCYICKKFDCASAMWRYEQTDGTKELWEYCCGNCGAFFRQKVILRAEKDLGSRVAAAMAAPVDPAAADPTMITLKCPGCGVEEKGTRLQPWSLGPALRDATCNKCNRVFRFDATTGNVIDKPTDGVSIFGNPTLIKVPVEDNMKFDFKFNTGVPATTNEVRVNPSGEPVWWLNPQRPLMPKPKKEPEVKVETKHKRAIRVVE